MSVKCSGLNNRPGKLQTGFKIAIFLISISLIPWDLCAKKSYVYRTKDGKILITDRSYDKDYYELLRVFESKKQAFLLSHGNYYKRKYHLLIVKYAHLNGLESTLLHSVIEIESGYDFMAISPKGAKGLMQLMDSTAEKLGVQNVFDPEQNISAGAEYLSALLVKYNQNIDLALAAYNAGPTAVDRYNGVPPYPETRSYIKKIKRLLSRYEEAGQVQKKEEPTQRKMSKPVITWKKENGKIILKHAD